MDTIKEITLEEVVEIQKLMGQASTPKGVENRIRKGMYLGHIKYLIKPDYIKKGCYLVYGKYSRNDGEIKFEPSYYTLEVKNMVWFFTHRLGLFMNRESNKEKPIAVIWKLEVNKNKKVPYGAKHIVIDILRFGYDEFKRITTKYAVYKKQLECFWKGYSWMEPSYYGRPFSSNEKLEERTWLE